jgi:hypothetical protein
MRTRAEIETERLRLSLSVPERDMATAYTRLVLEVALDNRDLLQAQAARIDEGDIKALKAEVKAEVDKLTSRIDFLEGGMKRIRNVIEKADMSSPSAVLTVQDIVEHALNPTGAYIPAVLIRKTQQAQFDEAAVDPNVLKSQT